jgi:hypothetical protein
MFVKLPIWMVVVLAAVVVAASFVFAGVEGAIDLTVLWALLALNVVATACDIWSTDDRELTPILRGENGRLIPWRRAATGAAVILAGALLWIFVVEALGGVVLVVGAVKGLLAAASNWSD